MGAAAEAYDKVDLTKVREGFANLAKHIENIEKFGITPVVAINKFPSDSHEEVEFVITACAKRCEGCGL